MPDTGLIRSTPVSDEAALKQDYFDRYWISRDYLRTDRRTMERAQLIWSHLARRRGKALDSGCGRGLFASFLAEQGLVVDATDISPQAVDLTAQRGINAYVLDLERHTPLGLYDLVFCLEVLQQVRDPESVLKRLAGVLAYDGELVLSLPNEFHLVRRLQVMAGRPGFGDTDDTHLKFFSPRRGAQLAARAGLEVRLQVYTSLIPPGLGPLSALGRLSARTWPSGLALSTLYFLRKAQP
jgi:2-polyprenyl-3-methyl-5-hydroxy-6-metoxy-1,4-benzoquinol methylase